ncbi:Maf family protein [Desulfurobacterium indicum]|uniref:dTTP/UTP pyrophosphatase n=1 Tax=Desulfurobacterium indicum TaxID=1914305 RepID=A0A1R1MN07_9BACT|nr:Maf family protein [Desulfurobacterium indicum]OMH41156.1 septum formation protein Maf [Desulfurobacterium indicum]
MKGYERFLLLSSSPRRREILKMIGIPFRVYSSFSAMERIYETPLKTAVENAVSKILAGCEKQESEELALAADTIVVINNQILGKPKNREKARTFLKMLSGKKHTVITGFAVRLPSGKIIKGYEESGVVFRDLSEGEISWYLNTGEPFDKAGAYGIQGYGALLVKRIEGDFFNVMGLPIAKIYDILLDNNIDIKKMVGR